MAPIQVHIDRFRKVADSAALLEPCGRRPVPTTVSSAAATVPHGATPPPTRRTAAISTKLELFEMPGLKSLVRGNGGGGRRSSTAETPTAPLVRRDASCGNIVRATASLASLKKCEPVRNYSNPIAFIL